MNLPLQILVRLNSKPSVGAFAIPESRYSVVTLNAGICVRLRQLFQFVVADGNVFPATGPEEPIGDEDTLRFGLSPAILLEEVDLTLRGADASGDDYVHLYGPIPASRSRIRLAKALTTAALDFVVMHEFAHIVRRHIELLPDGANDTSFSETSLRGSTDVEDDKVRHLLEVDADVVGGRLGMEKFTVPETLTIAWRGWANTPLEALRLWNLAVLMTFQLLDGWSNDINAFGDHPHPAPRLLTMMSGIWDNLPEHCPVKDVDSVVEDVVDKSRLLWTRMGLPLDRLHPYKDMDSVRATTLELIRGYNEKLLPGIGK